MASTSTGTDPLAVEVTTDIVEKLNGIEKELERADYILERRAIEFLAPVYEKRRAVLKSIPKFWPITLINCDEFEGYIVEEDRAALAHLEDVWVVRDPNEHRVYTITFEFAENPFFEDRILTKSFAYTCKSQESADLDSEGVSDALLDFDWDRDVTSTSKPINWKNPDEALTKKFPPSKSDVEGEEEDIVVGDPGSFFNFFEQKLDYHEQHVATTIVDEIFPEANDYFLGVGSDEEEDEDVDEDDV